MEQRDEARSEARASRDLKRLAELLLQVEVSGPGGEALSLEEGVSRAVGLVLAVRQAGRKIMAIGNGGSAAIASHLHNDLSASIGVRSLAFGDMALLTALANDYGYASVFERPLRLWAGPGDLLVAFSSSGRSENILAAARLAQEMGLMVITLTGFAADNPLRRLGQVNFWVPSQRYGQVEVIHQALAHYLTDRAKEELEDEAE